MKEICFFDRNIFAVDIDVIVAKIESIANQVCGDMLFQGAWTFRTETAVPFVRWGGEGSRYHRVALSCV